jgi:hypothetical protein
VPIHVAPHTPPRHILALFYNFFIPTSGEIWPGSRQSPYLQMVFENYPTVFA